MKVTEVKYMRRFNLGDYEHEEYAFTAAIDTKDDGLEAIEELKSLVAKARNEESTEQDDEEVEDEEEVETEEEDESEEDTEESDDEEEEDDEEVDSEETEDDDEEEEDEKPAAKKAKSKGKKTKSKSQGYSRDNETHKDLFGETLTAVWPQWKKTKANKAKGVALSKKFAGTDFLDADGNVLKTFKDALKKAVKAK
jgi:hypothetical protein